MILPNFRPPYLTPIKIKGTSDITPNALNWADIRFTASSGEHEVTEQQVTGISTPITLSINGVWGTDTKVYYRVASTPASSNPLLNTSVGGPFDPSIGDGTSSAGYTYNNPNPSFVVRNNDYVSFVIWGQDPLGPATWSPFTVTVKNESEVGSPTIDTFVGTPGP